MLEWREQYTFFAIAFSDNRVLQIRVGFLENKGFFSCSRSQVFRKLLLRLQLL